MGFWDDLEVALRVGLGSATGNPRRFTPTPGRLQRAPSIFNRPNARMGPPGTGLAGLNRPPTIEDIIAKLESLQDPSRYMADQDMLQRQAMGMANAQYDPIISRLRAQMGAAEQRGNRNREVVGSMFNQLSQNLAGEIPEIQEMYAGTKQATAGQYQQLQDTINKQYQQSQADQEAMMQRLNIQAAAPDVMEEQVQDQNFFVANSAKQGQVQQDALGQEERGAVEFTRQGSQNALTEGTQRQADIMAQLAELLAELEGEVSSASAAKNQSYLATLAGLQTDSQQGAMDRAQRDFENYIKVLNVGRMLQGGGEEMGPARSPADIAGRTMALGLDPQASQRVQSAFMTGLNDPMIQAGIDENFGQSLPREALAARIVEQGKRMGLGPQELNALQIAALEYFGRR